jgi:hypothetical protein
MSAAVARVDDHVGVPSRRRCGDVVGSRPSRQERTA